MEEKKLRFCSLCSFILFKSRTAKTYHLVGKLKVGPFSKVGLFSKVGPFSKVGLFSKVGSFSKVGPFSKVGIFSKVGSFSKVADHMDQNVMYYLPHSS